MREGGREGEMEGRREGWKERRKEREKEDGIEEGKGHGVMIMGLFILIHNMCKPLIDRRGMELFCSIMDKHEYLWHVKRSE